MLKTVDMKMLEVDTFQISILDGNEWRGWKE